MLGGYEAPNLQEIFKDKKRNVIRKKADELYEALEIHIEGKYPFQLINERRPNESTEIKEYRYKIYQNVFKSTTTRILTSLGKAKKAEGLQINYPVDTTSTPDAEKLQRYVTEDVPMIGNVVDWGFETMLKMMLMDANAICVVAPANLDKAQTEYLQPVPHIFDSDDVQYVNHFAKLVVLKGEKEKYTSTDGRKYDAEVFWVINEQAVEKWVQINSAKDFQLRESWNHNFGELPCFTLGGIAVDTDNGCILYESYIQGIVAWLNEAVREYSDLQAEVVQHIHSTFWAYSTQDCTKCRGTGQIGRNGQFVQCDASGCNSGKIDVSPFSNIMIKTSSLGAAAGQTIPVPPAGYITKNIDIVKLQWERIKEHIYNALASINMQFLDNVPLAQSGIAKSVDRDELDNFVHTVTSRLLRNVEHIIYLMALTRYSGTMSKEQIRELLPTFRIPMSFDLMNSSYLIDEIDKAKKANISPLIVSELEKQLAAKKFNDEPKVFRMVQAQYDLDPLLGLTTDEKLAMLTNDGISQIDYVVSCNLPRYITQAFEENEDFHTLPLLEKRDVLKQIAESEIESRSAAVAIGGESTNTLKGSVGGLTGIIEIVKAVSSGVYDLEAAVALVQDRFGLTEEQARAQIGTPQQITSANQVETISKLT